MRLLLLLALLPSLAAAAQHDACQPPRPRCPSDDEQGVAVLYAHRTDFERRAWFREQVEEEGLGHGLRPLEVLDEACHPNVARPALLFHLGNGTSFRARGDGADPFAVLPGAARALRVSFHPEHGHRFGTALRKHKRAVVGVFRPGDCYAEQVLRFVSFLRKHAPAALAAFYAPASASVMLGRFLTTLGHAQPHMTPAEAPLEAYFVVEKAERQWGVPSITRAASLGELRGHLTAQEAGSR